MIDFPASPTVGQQFTAAGVTWTWDGAKWLPSGLAPTIVGGINDNRIINGDMRIDQRNNGASGTAGGYTVDRWAYGATQVSKGVWQRVAGPAASGFPYCLMFTSSSAYSSAVGDGFAALQAIEADMISDFAWGTASAQSVTLSFWAGSSLAGTFSGCIRNYAGNRSYPFSFTLPAGPWTKITIIIPGDTTGTWVMSGNAGSMYLLFDLGSGANSRGPANAWASANYNGVTGAVSLVATNGATFYVTGVKLEIGSVATPFNRQSLTKSLADCQRYYQIVTLLMTAYQVAGQVFQTLANFPVIMRAAPTLAVSSSNNSNVSSVTLTSSVNAVWNTLGTTATASGTCVVSTTFSANAEL